ncbi:EAL domain-containing protein [Oceanirhabdus sp. W0125-5]|uniref:EAL domain-containing protein n=1 Tax=Oceanirhabdus sp. W0125-5 TaxID=2999116 RepID=UPI0022F2BA7B|nr:EAL domain-containing protein [Oceanirhabdus sp. W0125-5]WBW96733.1 EAL domain-containing protein [Oceanirhabdus sp. W0125-5]
MKRVKNNINKNVINKFKLIYLPLLITMLAILTVSISSFYISKKLLLAQEKQDVRNLTKQVIRQIEGNREALDVIDERLEDKIRIAGKLVITQEERLDNDYLKQLMKEIHADELNWMNEMGKILYSTIESYKGWSHSEGHPMYDFIHSKEQELMEDIRPNAISGVPTKYGAIKNKNGYVIQVGILAENIQKLTDEFSYQNLIESLVSEENLVFATLLDKNMKVIADSDKEEIDSTYNKHHDEGAKKALLGKESIIECNYEKKDVKVLEISVPVLINEQNTGALIIGVSLEHVYTSIYTIFITSSTIAILMFLVLLWVQNKNVIRPVDQLNQKINQIDLENNIAYRLPLNYADTFSGLILSMNNLLDKIDRYLCELKDNQQELEASNEEIAAAYEQLTASEEELRAQYDEIQCYTQKLESLKQKYEIAIKGTNSAVWEVDISDETLYFSQEFRNIVGTSIEKKGKLTQVLNEFLTKEDHEKFMKEFLAYKNGEIEEIYVQVKIKDYNEQIKCILVRGKGIYDESKSLKYISGILSDITKLKEQEAYIEHLAYNDALTNIPNRVRFFDKLEEVTSQNQSGAVMLLDLDNFKEINDTLGHIYGDCVLKKVAQELMSIKEENIFISRFGGDEFLVLMNGEEEILSIEKYAKKIMHIFKNKLIIEGEEIYISASLGITRYPVDSNKVNQLIMNADMAMYNVKGEGKNNYMFFNKEMTEKLKKQIEIERILREAINEDGFKLLYQPQVCTYTGKIIGFEALVRIKDHYISPAVFIQVAEENGMINQMGRWVTKQAINQIAIWKEKGLNIKPIAINFSAKQLNDKEYIEFLKNALKEKAVDAKYIEIEITESIFLDKKEETIVFLNELKDLGIKIALDDFGTGYSSLSYLTFLPVDKIKLDKSLCDKFLEIENISVMDNIISLAHSLNLEVLAEGVEDIEQYKRLKVAECNYIQGYLFSKPLEALEAEKIYEDNFLES